MTPLDSTVYSLKNVKNFSKPTAVICESYGCNNKSITRIAVSVGKLGEIDLNVCKSCIPKFSYSDNKNTAIINCSLDEYKEKVKLLPAARPEEVTVEKVYDYRNIRRR
jgi:hypothetical protein